MDISKLMMRKNQEVYFRKKNINSVEDLLRFFPLHYKDCSKITGILPKEELSCLIGTVVYTKKFDNKYHSFIAIVELPDGSKVKSTWFHMPYLYDRVSQMKYQKVFVCGYFDYDSYAKMPGTMNPFLFSNQIDKSMKLYAQYSSIKGVKPNLVQAYIDNAMIIYPFVDYHSEEFLQKYDLMPMYPAFKEQHYPTSMEKVEKSIDRFLFDDMLYYSLVERSMSKEVTTESVYTVKTRKTTDALIAGLPYTLTDDQNTVLESILDKMSAGKRVNGLVQGDVSCGKSIVCFLLAAAMAENGYQAAIMTPNKVLAHQHYEDLKELLHDTDINVAFYADTSKMSAKEKKEILSGLESGEIQIVVGTTSLIAESVAYKNLALAVVDEEHKFGVMQRKNFSEKGKQGIHTLIMSATPIPRTMAQTVYNKNTELYSIKSMPGGRKRVKSCVTNNTLSTIGFLKKELQAGHQAYIVCPMIEKNEDMENVMSAEELYEAYNNNLPEFSCAVLTGKTKKEESEDIIKKFKNNEIQVLIATSVIEVGVNVPNATVIIIHNAERFGLAGLHQLRGRVGRGKDQAYCIFFSDHLHNQRLDVISHTTDGFKIAEMDLQMRNPGDMLRGVRQSGKNKYVNLILSNKEKYELVRQAADEIETAGLLDEYLEKMENSFYAEVEA